MTEQAPEPITEEKVTATGHFAVFDTDLNQYVSGVGNKLTANAMKKELQKSHHGGVPLKDHKLEVREV